MVDYTMCHGGKCPIKEKCYRYRAKADEYMQSYFISLPYMNGGYSGSLYARTIEKDICEHYLDASNWGIE